VCKKADIPSMAHIINTVKKNHIAKEMNIVIGNSFLGIKSANPITNILSNKIDDNSI